MRNKKWKRLAKRLKGNCTSTKKCINKGQRCPYFPCMDKHNLDTIPECTSIRILETKFKNGGNK